MLGWHDRRLLKDVLPDKDARRFKKAFGYVTCGDLLGHYPRAYVRHGHDVGFGGAQPGDIVTITGTVTSANTRPTSRGQVLSVGIDDRITATFFNATWQPRVLRPGVRAMFSGKLTFYQGRPQLQHPDFQSFNQSATRGTGTLGALTTFGETDVQSLLADRDWIPIYPATSTLKSWYIMAAIHHVLATLEPVSEPLDQRQLCSFDTALREVHEPGPHGPERAIARLKYNEALAVALVMALRRRDSLNRRAEPLPTIDGEYRESMLAALPYELTLGQRRVIEEIERDLVGSVPMSRLLQGEVGSGKTVVATVAMLQAIDAGKQAALLAPTEVLAAQHAASIGASVPEGVRVVVLTGSMKTAAKRQALLDIVSGEADIVIGTHAIIQDSVEFFDLGLVVVDEQHRFGVEQRDRLRAKTRRETTPHMLVMTATPIPRTIAMTVFGDLAVSTLEELPGGRKPIQSSVVPQWRPTWLARALNRIREEVDQQHQAYVVCPRIDGEGGVLEVAEQLSQGPLRGVRIGVLHGRMTDKDAVMAEFARGEIDVLVATTVIEVGVDVPNATVMLIREAESFGVSQLHQLRGRVGRGGNASLCLLHTLAEEASLAFERLTQVAATSSGFDLAELDLRQRQEGDVLGTLQSGSQRTLRLLNLAADRDIVERTHADAFALVERDPALAQRLSADLTETEQEYLDKS